jgi:hypothetical protein
MSEEIEAGVAPAPEAVEAAPAEAAPSAEVAPSSDDAPVAEDSSRSEAPESGEGAPASLPSAEAFGWDDWDGDHEAFHKELRPWSEKINSHHAKKLDAQTTKHTRQVARLEDLYKTLLGGEEDPRIGEFEGKVTEWETKYNGLQDEFDKYQNSIKESIQQESQAYASWFKEQNTDIFENEKLSEVFVELLESGWDLETAAEAARLPQTTREVAMKAKADGVPDSYALRLAAGTKKVVPAPRPGAKLIAGATTPARSAEQKTVEPDGSAMSFKDYRAQIARNAIKKHRS